MEIMPLLSGERPSGFAVNEVNQLATVHFRSVSVIIVMVEESASFVHVHGETRGPQCRSRVSAQAFHLANPGVHRREKPLRRVHLHAVWVSLIVRLARNGVHHHHHSARIHHYPDVRIGPIPVRRQHGPARKTAAPAENHVSGAQLTSFRKYAPLLRFGARRQHGDRDHYGKELFHGFAKASRSKYSENSLNGKTYAKIFTKIAGKPLSLHLRCN